MNITCDCWDPKQIDAQPSIPKLVNLSPLRHFWWGSEQFSSLFPLRRRESYLQFTSQVDQSHIQLNGADLCLTGELWWIGWMPENTGRRHVHAVALPRHCRHTIKPWYGRVWKVSSLYLREHDLQKRILVTTKPGWRANKANGRLGVSM